MKQNEEVEVEYYDNGNKKHEYHYKDENKKTGFVVSWYKSGNQESEKHYKNDKFDGVWTWWHENGNLQEKRTHKNGKQDGLHTCWNKLGEKEFQYIYKDGKLVEKQIEDFQVVVGDDMELRKLSFE